MERRKINIMFHRIVYISAAIALTLSVILAVSSCGSEAYAQQAGIAAAVSMPAHGHASIIDGGILDRNALTSVVYDTGWTLATQAVYTASNLSLSRDNAYQIEVTAPANASFNTFWLYTNGTYTTGAGSVTGMSSTVTGTTGSAISYSYYMTNNFFMLTPDTNYHGHLVMRISQAATGSVGAGKQIFGQFQEISAKSLATTPYHSRTGMFYSTISSTGEVWSLTFKASPATWPIGSRIRIFRTL